MVHTFNLDALLANQRRYTVPVPSTHLAEGRGTASRPCTATYIHVL